MSELSASTLFPIAVVAIPLRTVSLSNQREHWAKRHSRGQREKRIVAMALGSSSRTLKANIPLRVEFTRVAPRKLDSDNLASAFKSIRDAVARVLGVNDGDESLVRWGYAQERGKPKEYSVRITFWRCAL